MPTKPPVVEADGNSQFVVTGAAVTVTTGRKPNGQPKVTRLRKGAILTAPANHPSVQRLIESRCLAPYEEGKVVKPATARVVAKAFGAADDPVKAPVQSVLPVSPSAGEPLTV